MVLAHMLSAILYRLAWAWKARHRPDLQVAADLQGTDPPVPAAAPGPPFGPAAGPGPVETEGPDLADVQQTPDTSGSDRFLNVANPFDQVEAVAKVEFETWPMLNKSEARLLPVLEGATRDFGEGHRLMAQTSLGELIRPRETSGSHGERNLAYRSINSKRLDFALIDRFGHLVAAIEYQGSGHNLTSTAFASDAVKKEALRKAGVAFFEILDGDTPEQIRDRIRRLLRPAAKPAPDDIIEPA